MMLALKSRSVETLTTETWPASETAFLICDTWDKHWCPKATERVNQLAPAINLAANAARAAGAAIIHAPSNCMKFYEGTGARKAAMLAPPSSM